ncbi:MAG: ABC transporter ATP-binding protein, partial [Actinophytocola sp.]|nr:ABC transporter ATP-binding protein [Actinophytocola sp.]
VTIQAQIIELLRSLAEERGMAVILISHDLSVLARFAQRVVVMYAGKVVEEGPVDTIYYRPAHPYTAGLMASVPRLRGPRDARPQAIGGQPPSLVALPPGCAFQPRCLRAVDVCTCEAPRLAAQPDGPEHRCACHLTEPGSAEQEAAPS